MRSLKRFIKDILYWIFRHLPLKDKVVATSCKGMLYGDNTRYILEELHSINPDIRLFWLKSENCDYEVPSWIQIIPYGTQLRKIRSLYELATAKVWIDTHRPQVYLKKRPNQLFIETWHGGLGIKKIEMDSPAFATDINIIESDAQTCKYADVFISQSDHLSNIYRTAFHYNGPIWKVGFPKSDILFKDSTPYVTRVKTVYGIEKDEQIVLYAPTFRDWFWEKIDYAAYNIDYQCLIKSLKQKFGGNWRVLTRFHPFFSRTMGNTEMPKGVINATDYPDMQELIMATDVMVSDYSSCLFDAALREIPCFTFATDFERYKACRGVYYEMNELPFPYAINNDELEKNILNFNSEEYNHRWQDFKVRTGLYEAGHAGRDIAIKINDFIRGEKIEWNKL